MRRKIELPFFLLGMLKQSSITINKQDQYHLDTNQAYHYYSNKNPDVVCF